MFTSTCNSTLSETHWDTDTIVGNLTLHTLGWLICGGCAIIATFISLCLIHQHAGHYTNPGEQRHIIRILLMVPIYAITSWLSYVWYWHAIYWEVARDCYEAFAIAAFFALLCSYIHPTLRGQKNFFTILTVKPWPWPCGRMAQPRSGLTWFNIIWIGVFQYVFIRVAMTITATVTQAKGLYCEESLHPKYAHLWTMFFNMVAVTIAMYCLIAFYLGVKEKLAPNKPFFKLLCIKLVIFFSFWQMILLDLLTSAGAIKSSKYMSLGDISVGFNSLLICFEMIIFAILHLFAFTWKDYDKGPASTTPVMASLLDAFNPWDIVRGIARGTRWLICGIGRRERDHEKIRKRLELEEEASGLVGAAASFAGAGDYSPPPPPQPVGPDALPIHPTPQKSQQLKVQTAGYGGYSPEPVEMYNSPARSPASYSQQVAASGYGNALASPHEWHGRYRDQSPSPVELSYPTTNYMPSGTAHQLQGSPVYLHSPNDSAGGGLLPIVRGQSPRPSYKPYEQQGGGQQGGGGYHQPF
ncbi:putative DUF300 domain protein [Morchella snyderi]|nr:putative DUF300 domain protein [Morchella snyderi]